MSLHFMSMNFIFIIPLPAGLVRQPSIIYVQHTEQGTSYQVQYLQPEVQQQQAAPPPQLGGAATASAVFGDHADYHVATTAQTIVPVQQQQQF